MMSDTIGRETKTTNGITITLCMRNLNGIPWWGEDTLPKGKFATFRSVNRDEATRVARRFRGIRSNGLGGQESVAR